MDPDPSLLSSKSIRCAWEQDVEQGLKEFAAGVETTLDKLLSGALGTEMTRYMDALLRGFIRGFETNYSKFEKAVRQTLRLQGPAKGGVYRKTRSATAARQPKAVGRRLQARRSPNTAHPHLWMWEVFSNASSDDNSS